MGISERQSRIKVIVQKLQQFVQGVTPYNLVLIDIADVNGIAASLVLLANSPQLRQVAHSAL
jgi:hypothetical protein